MEINTTHSHTVDLTREDVEAALIAYITPRFGSRIRQIYDLQYFQDDPEMPEGLSFVIEQADIIPHETAKEG